jgi:hypothetical protein
LPELFCGIDWAEHHHDVALVDRSCRVEAQLRIGDDAAGYRQLVDVLADHGDTPEEPIPVAIETGRGLLVACLHANARGRPGAGSCGYSPVADSFSGPRKRYGDVLPR